MKGSATALLIFSLLTPATSLPLVGADAALSDPALRTTPSNSAAWKRIAPFFAPPAPFAGEQGSYRSPLLFNDGTPVRSAADWPRRRSEILRQWQDLMGPWPPLLERPGLEVLSRTHRDNFDQRRVRLEIAPGQTGEGWLLVPDGAGRKPAVLVVYYEPETSAGLSTNALRDFGFQLARRGFVTLNIGTPGGNAWKPETGAARCQPLSFHAYVAAHAWKALAGLPEVDPARIGMTGHSYGGKWAMFAAALWERFACVAVSDPGIVFDETRPNVNYWEPWYLGFDPAEKRPKPGLPAADNPRTGAYRKMIETGRDLHELHALIAPRPFLVSGGAEDPPSRWVALNHTVAVNRLLGFTNRVALTSRQGHNPTEESNEQLYAFFEFFLAPAPAERALPETAVTAAAPTATAAAAGAGPGADLILHHGRIVTVDRHFSIAEAMAVRDGRIVQVGRDGDVLQRRGPGTEVMDLEGRPVLPGLMDSHAHPADACLTEFDHPIPQMEAIPDVLEYIRARARVVPEGEWIQVRQVFITRLREQRYPTRAELDAAAPGHPVLFSTGPDASLNSLALKASGIDRDFKVSDGGSGFAEKDPATGEPTGILRNCSRYVKVKTSRRGPTREEKVERLRALFADYNAVGLTSVGDRDASPDEIETYEALRAAGGLSVRASLSHHVDSIGPLDRILENIRQVSRHPLFTGRDDRLRIIGIKTYLDGGMLTGSAYMRQPWGVSAIYGITDPAYRGVRFIPADRLEAMVRATVQCGLQFTAHSVGDGAVHALLDAYAAVDKDLPVRPTRPCISHSNFMSREAVEESARLGVMLDIQPAWLYLDAHTLLKQFGPERLRYFQPLRSIFEAGGVAGGGSDHMQKIGSLRSVNPYNPFLGMATAVTRKARMLERPLHPEESLTREQAIRFYTINNARILACDDRLGSLEPGKQADFIVIDTDLLTCPDDRIAGTQVLQTYLGGKLVYRRP